MVDRQQIVNLAREGMPRNEIARHMRCSTETVSKWAHRAGIRFDRTKTAAATEARQADTAARRAEAAAGLLDDLDTIRARLTADDGITHPRDLRDWGSTIASLARSHAELVRIDLDRRRDADAGEHFSTLLDQLLDNALPPTNGPAA